MRSGHTSTASSSSADGPIACFDTTPGLRERLLAHGFREEFLGDDRPPVTHYHLSGNDAGFYVEFLTPLVGAEFTRGGDRDVTTPIVGVSAQKLRHLDVLLFSPWTVTLQARGTPHSVLIANPVSYLAQKLLISAKRTPGARAKDILYIHDTLSLFSRSLPELHDMTGLGGVPRGDRLGRLAAAAASEYTS